MPRSYGVQTQQIRRAQAKNLGRLLQADPEALLNPAGHDLAEQEGMTVAFVCRLLSLTCFAPDIVEAILDGRQPRGLRLSEMLGNGPLHWGEQRARWGPRGLA